MESKKINYKLCIAFIIPLIITFYFFNPFSIKNNLGLGLGTININDEQITGADNNPSKLILADILQIPLHIRWYEIHIRSSIPKDVLQNTKQGTLLVQVLSGNPRLNCEFAQLKKRSEDLIPRLDPSKGPTYEIPLNGELCILYDTNNGISFRGAFVGEYNSNYDSDKAEFKIYNIYIKQTFRGFLIKFLIIFFIFNSIWFFGIEFKKNICKKN